MNTPDPNAKLKFDPKQYVLVDDRKSAVTIFAFAGGVGRFGGMPVFEFRNLLLKHGGSFNLVFIRDVWRVFYHLTPDRKPNGLDFFADLINQSIKELGSTYHVALGGCMGGSASLYFGARCGMNQVISFNPIFPLVQNVSPAAVMKDLMDVKTLAKNPGGFCTRAILLGALKRGLRRTARGVGWDHIVPMRDAYKPGGPYPRTTIFYPKFAPYEEREVQYFAQFPGAEIIGLPTVIHSTPRYLKKHGQLAAAITERVNRGLADAGVMVRPLAST